MVHTWSQTVAIWKKTIDFSTNTIERFFKDYPLTEYLNVINQLKDWDLVKEYYGDEEEYNSFSDKDWNELINSIII